MQLNRKDTFRLVIYFYSMTGNPNKKLPKNWDKIPGARGCTLENSFFRDNFGTEDVQYEPSEGTAVVFPPYLESKVNINLSNEDLIYFKANMSLSLLGDWVNPNE